MLRMDGHEATKRIVEATPTPIVVVTSATRQEMVHKDNSFFSNPGWGEGVG